MHHVSIFVRDLERSLELFSGLLGLEKVKHLKGVKGRQLSRLLGLADFEADMVFLKHPSQHILLELVRQTGGSGDRPWPAGPSGFGLSFVVRDLAGLHARLAKGGWQPLSEPLRMPGPDGKPLNLFCFLTEEGFMVELIEAKG